MKNYKRAYRRWKKQVKFKRRVNLWIHDLTYNRKDGLKERILKGESHRFLKTTGCPCNCYMCSGMNKYKKIPKFKILKECFNDINYHS
jgi:hypothetical protein